MNPAETRALGKTGLTITRMGVGTAPIGGLYEPVPVSHARAALERALDLKLRLFDTAPLYGTGVAEQRLGEVLSHRPRDQFVISTKVGRVLRPGHSGDPLYKGTPPLGPVFDFSYDGVMTSLQESLRRLQLERVDILYIHDPDEHHDQALSGAYRALDRLRGDGTIHAVGAGMNQAEMLARFAQEADFDCFLLAGRYTLLDQSALPELLPLCVERSIAIVIGGVYNSGILADPRPGSTFDYLPAGRQWLEKALRLKEICDRYGVPLKAAALQFPLAHPAVATVLVGVRSVEELEENAGLFQIEIPAELWHTFKAEGLLPAEAPVPS